MPHRRGGRILARYRSSCLARLPARATSLDCSDGVLAVISLSSLISQPSSGGSRGCIPRARPNPLQAGGRGAFADPRPYPRLDQSHNWIRASIRLPLCHDAVAIAQPAVVGAESAAEQDAAAGSVESRRGRERPRRAAALREQPRAQRRRALPSLLNILRVRTVFSCASGSVFPFLQTSSLPPPNLFVASKPCLTFLIP